jgi:hypothetical protein
LLPDCSSKASGTIGHERAARTIDRADGSVEEAVGLDPGDGVADHG